MKYPYMTLNDDTEITHSDLREDGSVLVYIETPTDTGFNHASCILPTYKWEDVVGYNENDLQKIDKIIHNNAHLILEFAAAGGFANASAI